MVCSQVQMQTPVHMCRGQRRMLGTKDDAGCPPLPLCSYYFETRSLNKESIPAKPQHPSDPTSHSIGFTGTSRVGQAFYMVVGDLNSGPYS